MEPFDPPPAVPDAATQPTQFIQHQLDRIERTVDAIWRVVSADVYRMVPVIGPVSEQPGPAATTPPPLHHYGPKVGILMANISISDSQQLPLSIAFADKKGNPVTQPAGTLTWLVDNPALLTLTPSADGLSCVAAAAGPLGVANISVKLADANGNTIAAGTISVEIDAGAATTIVVTPGTPTEES